jgi:hypothetical protein
MEDIAGRRVISTLTAYQRPQGTGVPRPSRECRSTRASLASVSARQGILSLNKNG